MFDETLLDSSPLRQPVLGIAQRVVSLTAGLATFLASLLYHHRAAVPFVTRTAVGQSLAIGVVVAFTSLMLCYVYADAQQLRLSARTWLAAVLLFNVIGFLAYLLYAAHRTGNWKRVTLPMACVLEFAVGGVLMLLPLLYTEALPKAWSVEHVLPPLGQGLVRRARTLAVNPRRPAARQIVSAPAVIPKHIALITETKEPVAPTLSAGVTDAVPGGLPGGQGGIPYGLGLDTSPPPPPVPAAKAPNISRVHVVSVVEAAKLIYGPKPDYPPLAKMAHIQGTVKLEAIIGKDGTIQNLQVLKGHPLLIPAATDAVARWRYQPTLLDGNPVEVVTEVDVNFVLGE